MKLHNTGIFKKEVNKNIDILLKKSNQINSTATLVHINTPNIVYCKNWVSFLTI
jgi:hypothetical protein